MQQEVQSFAGKVVKV